MNLKFYVKSICIVHSVNFKIYLSLNFGGSRNSRLPFFAILKALTCVDSVHFSLQKVQKFIKSQNSTLPKTKKLVFGVKIEEPSRA